MRYEDTPWVVCVSFTAKAPGRSVIGLRPLLVFDPLKKESGRGPFIITLLEVIIGHQQPEILKNRALHHFTFVVLHLAFFHREDANAQRRNVTPSVLRTRHFISLSPNPLVPQSLLRPP